MSTRRCPRCGKRREDWSDPEGFEHHGRLFCCSGCGQGDECLCPEPLLTDPPEHRRERIQADLEEREGLFGPAMTSDDDDEGDPPFDHQGRLPLDKQLREIEPDARESS